jgi:hypothetical protein
METFVNFVIFCELSALRFNFASLREIFLRSFLRFLCLFAAIPVSPPQTVNRGALLAPQY